MLLSRLFFRIIIHCFNFKNGFFNHTDAFIRIFLYIIAPESDYRPSQKKELLVDFIIPLFVSGYFTNPIFTIITLFQSRLKHFPIFAVEKLSIAKNCYFIFSKYNIRLAWQFFIILPKICNLFFPTMPFLIVLQSLYLLILYVAYFSDAALMLNCPHSYL